MITDLVVSLGIVIFLVILILVVYWRYRHADHYSVTTPARPNQRRAIRDLVDSMKTAGAKATGVPGAERLSRTMTASAESIGATPPTYSNYLEVYRGLADREELLHSSANQFIRTARDEKDLAKADVGRAINNVIGQTHVLGVTLAVE